MSGVRKTSPESSVPGDNLNRGSRRNQLRRGHGSPPVLSEVPHELSSRYAPCVAYPHRIGRADFPHPALFIVRQFKRIYTHIDFRFRQWVLLHHFPEPFPCITFLLTPPVQPLVQRLFYLPVEQADTPTVIGQSIVMVVSN